MYNHNKAQQSKNRVHISWDILYVWSIISHFYMAVITCPYPDPHAAFVDPCYYTGPLAATTGTATLVSSI